MKDFLPRLVKLVAARDNPHDLITEVAADADLLDLCRQLYRENGFGSVPGRPELIDLCRANRVPVAYFSDRLELIARILNFTAQPQDYYHILNIHRNASQQEIRRAFRQQSLASHPDTNPGDPDAAERFRSVLQAYEILGNEQLRDHYDRSLTIHEWVEQAPGEAGEESSSGMRKRTWLCLAGALAAGLLLLVFSIDYQGLMTEKYYHYRAGVQSRRGADSRSEPQQDLLQRPMPDLTAAADRFRMGGGGAALPAGQCKDGGLTGDPNPGIKTAERLLLPAASSVLSTAAPEGRKPDIPELLIELASMQESPRASRPAPGVPEQVSGNSPADEKKVGEKAATAKDSKSGKDIVPEKPSAKVADKVSEGTETGNAAQRAETEKPAEKTADAAPQRKKDEDDEQRVASVPVAAPPTPVEEPGVVAAEEQRVEPVESLRERVEDFLRRYALAYQQRDLNLFSSFFAENAVENGRPVKSLTSEYLNTFARTEKIRFQIHLRNLSRLKDGVDAEGSFHLTVQTRGGSPVESEGSISLELVETGDDFKVRALDYAFVGGAG